MSITTLETHNHNLLTMSRRSLRVYRLQQAVRLYIGGSQSRCVSRD